MQGESALSPKLSGVRRKNFAVFLIIVGLMFVAFGTVLIYGPSAFGAKSAFTMKDLQNDYEYRGPTYNLLGEEKLCGNFRSFNDGDTVLFRDKVVRIELTGHQFGGGTVTNLFFEAFFWPDSSMLEHDANAKAGNMTWYVCYYYPQYSKTSMETNFPMSGQRSSEAVIGVDGDVSDRVHEGDTIELTMHVYNKFSAFPGSTTVDEIIREFKFLVAENEVIVSGGVSSFSTLYTGVPLISLGSVCLIMVLFLKNKRTPINRIGAITTIDLSFGFVIILWVVLGQIGGWLMTTFPLSVGRLISTALGGWWLQGFGLILGLVIGFCSFVAITDTKASDRDDWWAVFAIMTIAMVTGLTVTLATGSVIWSALYGFIASWTPLWNIFTIPLFIAGIIIPLYIGLRVAFFVKGTVDGIIDGRRSSATNQEISNPSEGVI
ncbi:MAG: hypothetical protein QXX08_11125 [Candidatus Bathyarchaeia archaeon]